jgi:hypothetical protein
VAATLVEHAPERARSFRGVLLSGIVLALAGAGAVLAVGILSAGGHRAAGAPATAGPAVSTSFGHLVVEGATRAPMARPKFGTKHDPIGPHKVQVNVTVALTNSLDRTVLYSPGQFRLRLGESGVTIAGLGVGARSATTLQPDESVRTGLSFIAPRRARKFSLEFRDIGLARPIRIELGRVPLSGRAELPPAPHPHGADG